MCFHVPVLQWSLQFLVRVFTFLSLILCYSYFGTFLSSWFIINSFLLLFKCLLPDSLLFTVECFVYSPVLFLCCCLNAFSQIVCCLQFSVLFTAQFQTMSVSGLGQPGLVTLQHQPIQPQGTSLLYTWVCTVIQITLTNFGDGYLTPYIHTYMYAH